jgi:hypothetical protein
MAGFNHAANVIETATAKMTEVLRDDKPLEARDWAGFFAALASFIQIIAPLIIPLITGTNVANKN